MGMMARAVRSTILLVTEKQSAHSTRIVASQRHEGTAQATDEGRPIFCGDRPLPIQTEEEHVAVACNRYSLVP